MPGPGGYLPERQWTPHTSWSVGEVCWYSFSEDVITRYQCLLARTHLLGHVLFAANSVPQMSAPPTLSPTALEQPATMVQNFEWLTASPSHRNTCMNLDLKLPEGQPQETVRHTFFTQNRQRSQFTTLEHVNGNFRYLPPRHFLARIPEHSPRQMSQARTRMAPDKGKRLQWTITPGTDGG
ncbi:hypothetical protein IW262DRAFT_1293721 [Armillaria fumosa]|nr:hypothetical protein IW262DRAFT_1293721 [Armillaria fumosa]